MGIGLADCTSEANGRMPQKRLFDFGRIDIVAPTNDKVFGTASDPQIPIFIHTAQVARAQVFFVIIKVFVLFSFSIGVPNINTGVRNTNLTNFIDLGIDWAVVCAFNDFDVGVWERDPNTTNFLLTVHWVTRHKASCLCHTITLDDGNACCFLKAFEQLHRQRRRARECSLNRADICIHCTLHHCSQRRWNGDDEGHFPALCQLPDIIQNAFAAVPLRRWEHDMCPTGQCTQQHDLTGHHVEQWQWTQHNVVFIQQYFCANPTVVNRARIKVLRNLWHACRATSVEIEGDAIFLNVFEIKCRVLLVKLCVKVFVLHARRLRHLWADQRDDPAFGRGHITQQVDFQDCLHIRGQSNCSGCFLSNISLWERT